MENADISNSKVAQNGWKVAFVIVMLTTLANQFASNGWTPLQPAIMEILDMSYSQLGFFTGITGIMGVVAGIPVGIISKKYGTKFGATMGLTCVAVGLCILGFCSNFTTAVAGRMVWMFGFQTLKIVLPAAILILAPKRISSFVMSFNFVVINLATFLGSPFAAAIEGAFSWHVAFYAFAAVIVLMGIMFVITFREPDKTDEPQESGKELCTINPYRSGLAWAVAILVAICAGGVLTPLYYYSAAVLGDQFGFSSMQIAQVNMVYSVGAIVLLLINGWLSTKLGKTKMLAVIEMLICAVAAVMMTMDNSMAFLVGMVAIMSVGVCASALVHTLPGQIFPKNELTKVFGMVQLIAAGFGGYVLPQIMGVLMDVTGGTNICWWLVAAMCVITIIIMALLPKNVK